MMHEFSQHLMPAILRATILLSIGFVVAFSLLKLLKIRSVRVHSLAWIAVLLQAVMLWPTTISLPVLDPEPATEPVYTHPTLTAFDEALAEEIIFTSTTTEAVEVQVDSAPATKLRHGPANGRSGHLDGRHCGCLHLADRCLSAVCYQASE